MKNEEHKSSIDLSDNETELEEVLVRDFPEDRVFSGILRNFRTQLWYLLHVLLLFIVLLQNELTTC